MYLLISSWDRPLVPYLFRIAIAAATGPLLELWVVVWFKLVVLLLVPYCEVCALLDEVPCWLDCVLEFWFDSVPVVMPRYPWFRKK